MREALMVLLLVAALGLAAGLWLADWRTLMWVGASIHALGWVVGLLAGIAFHVALRCALRRRGPVPRGWIWRPISLERNLDPGQRKLTAPLMYVGGAGFGLIVLGLVVLATGMIVALATV